MENTSSDSRKKRILPETGRGDLTFHEIYYKMKTMENHFFSPLLGRQTMMKEVEVILRYKWCLSDAPTLITISGILLLRSCARVAGIYIEYPEQPFIHAYFPNGKGEL